MLTLCNGRIKDGPTPVKAPHTRRRLTSRFYLSLLCSNTRRIAIFLVSIPCYSCTSISFSLSLSHLVSFFSLLYIVSLPFYSIVSPVLSISILFFYFHASSFFVVLRSLSEYYSIAPLKSYLSSPFFALRFASCSTSTSFYDLPRVYNIPTRRCSIPLRTLCKHTPSTHALRLSKVLRLRYSFPRLVGRRVSLSRMEILLGRWLLRCLEF